MKKILWMGIAALAFAACSEKEDIQPELDVISFEKSEQMLDSKGTLVTLPGVELNGWTAGIFENVLCAKSYMDEEDKSGNFYDGLFLTTADGMIGFGSYFTDFAKSPYGASDTWGGFTLSQNFCQTPAENPDYANEHFSAWTTGGAKGSRTFAIAYENGTEYAYSMPKIKLTEPRTLYHLYVANATMTVQYTSPKADYWFAVSITGYLAGQEGKSVEVRLINGKEITSDWIKVNCSSLGKVDEVRFKVLSNDMSGNYLNCPSYFCIDEIALVKQAVK